ncbi:MAG: hypothetical protein CMH53_07235, partial [Myxococcales bacterium]|nr:hypothetical protein [Myxococcales bacterium]
MSEAHQAQSLSLAANAIRTAVPSQHTQALGWLLRLGCIALVASSMCCQAVQVAHAKSQGSSANKRPTGAVPRIKSVESLSTLPNDLRPLALPPPKDTRIAKARAVLV